jgi:hypothetical protein
MRYFPVLAGALLLLCDGAAGATFRTIRDKTISGELASVNVKGVVSIRPETGEPVRVAADELMRIEFIEGRQPDEPIEGVILHLPRGDRLTGTLAAASQTRLTVRSRSLGSLDVPLDALIAVEFRRAGTQPKNAEKMREELLENKTENDISFAATGDQMPGIVTRFARDQVVLKTALREMPLKRSRLFGIAFAARKRPPPPTTLLAVVRAVDGSLVTGQLRPSADGRLRLKLLFGPEIAVDTANLIDVTFKQGKLVYLSDLEPADVAYTPYFAGDTTWPYQRDRNYDRGPIRLGGKEYRKGLGTFSGMELTYDLGAEFKTFAARAGIDDADVNRHGNVTVRVLGDGKELFRKEALTRKSGPVEVDVPVKGVRKLRLVVEFGGNMHFGDLTDWAEAHLIR